MAELQEPLVLDYDLEVGAHTQWLFNRLDVVRNVQSDYFYGLAARAGGLARELGGPCAVDAVANQGVIYIESGLYHFRPSSRPQAARVLGVQGMAYLKSALTHRPGSVLGGEGLDKARRTLEAARRLVAPFVVSEPGYQLSTVKRREAEDTNGNPVRRHMTVGRHQRHELIKGSFAHALSSLGRIALAEGNEAGIARLGEAHDVYLASSDKVGQTRNIMYMLMNERARDSRVGQLGYNGLRLTWALTAAAVRGQFHAWKVAARMAPHVLTQSRAQRARTDWRAV
ncbi:MAG TPA: hypothetical protein VJ836_01710 [Candidatus Saccharimonadales bacterium]|nr:hypothetical protein [Candidatus Saccharimonadales bacterium]